MIDYPDPAPQTRHPAAVRRVRILIRVRLTLHIICSDLVDMSWQPRKRSGSGPRWKGSPLRRRSKELRRTADEWMKEIEEAMAKFDAHHGRYARGHGGMPDSALDEVGEFDMGVEGDEYVIRLSQNARGKIRFDPKTRKDPHRSCPTTSLWRQGLDGRWDRLGHEHEHRRDSADPRIPA